ncbi:MAG TPA: hypothetical protein VG167_18910 [Verrucomicrobiae bacterium]|nr:hypothetical protein [Verrucomicrobiae bacterium]
MNKTHKLLILASLLLTIVFAALGQPLLGFISFLVANTILACPAPRCCANALGTLAPAQVIVMEALSLVFAKRPILKNISTGFTDKDGSPYALFNQEVFTRTLGIPPVQAFGAAVNARADTDVGVTLNQYSQVYYQFTPQQYSATNRDLIRESAQPLATAIANYMVDQVATLWTPANYPARTGADAIANNATLTKSIVGAGWDYTHLQSVRGILNKAGVPLALPRFYVGNSDVYASLLNDQRIVAALYNQANGEAIRTGNLPEVGGFRIDEYPNLTAVAGNNLVGVAGTPDSTVYAARVAKDPREMPGFEAVPVPGLMSVITEPKTGLSVNMDLWVDMLTRNANIRLSWMWGVATGNVNNLQLVTSQ